MKALGLIETVGYSTAVYAADAGLKAAEVKLRGIERVIGVAGSLGVSIEFEGEVAAVEAAIAAAKEAGERVGRVVSVLVIPRLHDEVSHRILPLFELDVNSGSGGASERTVLKEESDGQITESPGDDPAEPRSTGDSTRKVSSNKRRTKHE